MENHKQSILKAIRDAQRRPEDDPSNTQTADTISAHYRNAKVGDLAVIRETYGGSLNFRQTKIEAINGPRVYLTDDDPYGYAGPAFYLKSGKNCRSPTGQAHLVIPTQPILDFAVANPKGKQISGSLTNFPYRARCGFDRF
jgi:2',3'-cyclic-nucleotide 2'-phosphodiesterase (5'-nucleotidase family)